jgi:glycerol uptake facilitator-like aquaporin
MQDLWRRTLAEFIGTALLLAAVVGSGIMGAKLAAGNDAIALLANSIATGGVLVALIASLAPISGAHFNPAVTAFEFMRGQATWQTACAYVAAQLSGAVAGVVVAHAMFGQTLLQQSTHVRATIGEQIGEAVATFGLLLTIWGVARSRAEAVPYAVAAYIVGAYWFTSSTSFANPAVTLARSLTDTFAGIEANSLPGFLIAQAVGLLLAFAIATALGGGKHARVTRSDG